MIDLSIIIVNWNNKDFLEKCIESIIETSDGLFYEIIVVDNNSSDGSADMIRKRFHEVRLIANEKNLGYARGNNQGYAICRGKNIILLNPDIIFHPNAIEIMVKYAAKNTKIGAVVCYYLNADGTFQWHYRRFPKLSTVFFCFTYLGQLIDKAVGNKFARYYFAKDIDFSKTTTVEQPSASCLLIKRQVIDGIGLFDEHFPILFNDVDLCKRIWNKGYEIHVHPDAMVTHFLGQGLKNLSTDYYVVELLNGLMNYFKKYNGYIIALLARWIIIFGSLAGISILPMIYLVSFKKHETLKKGIDYSMATLRNMSKFKPFTKNEKLYETN